MPRPDMEYSLDEDIEMSIIRYDGTVPFVFGITGEERSQAEFESEAEFGRS
jgi:hypothetical protein